MEQQIEAIRALIDKYEKLLSDHSQIYRPIEQTTKEEDRLCGYDSGLMRAVSDLKDILYRCKIDETIKDILAYTD